MRTTKMAIALLLATTGGCDSTSPEGDAGGVDAGTTTIDTGPGSDAGAGSGFGDDPTFALEGLAVRYEPALDAIVFELEVAGDAASTTPTPAGSIDGAPVLGYVLATSLDPTNVGFDAVGGTVALAVTSHPDFDDTPLWDEDRNDAYDDDGVVYHAHWVVLVEDERAPAGLAVRQAVDSDELPPTAPMPMYLDSPGFTVIEDGAQLRVLVPADRLQRRMDFLTGALTAYMEVDASGSTPLLAAHEVLSALGDGTPNTAVAASGDAPASAWPTAPEAAGTLDVVNASGVLIESLNTYVLTIQTAGAAASHIPTPVGTVDGAPVVGYVFPTDIAPTTVGFTGTTGALVLAVTSHPDFDDTPLWDESMDADFGNDGAIYHVHWAVLVDDTESPAGLSVPSQPDASQLPPTAPMAMYLDSPGYHAFASGNSLHVLVPGWHLAGAFNFGALTARMRVDASGANPVLRVEEVVSAIPDALTLPLSPTSRTAP